MRICSLVPGATEVVAALGLGDHLVGISHECDYPPSIRHATVMIESLVSGGETSSSAMIDREVKALSASGQRLYRLNKQAFVQARPDVVLTQDLCHVCAITPDQLTEAIHALPSPPQVLTLSPTTLDDVMTDVERIGSVIGRPSQGVGFAWQLRKRLDALRMRTTISTMRPRVVCLEWLSPLYVAGHWLPEMVHIAGGKDVLGRADQPSREVTWNDVDEAKPDVAILAPCGFSVARSFAELESLVHHSPEWAGAIASWSRTLVVDAASYFSRPGPRLVEGVELLAAIFSGEAPPWSPVTAVRDVSPSSFPMSPQR